MLHDTPIEVRAVWIDRIRRSREAIAQAVTDAFFRRHPDWLERYGERGIALGIEDACFHLDFLLGAVHSGAVSAFEDYTRWTARMLQARGIAPPFLAENLAQIDQQLATVLPPEAHAAVGAVLQAGCQACLQTPGDLAVPAGPRTDLDQVRSVFLQAALQGQRAGALTIVLEALRAGHAILDLYVEVLQETLYEVGRRWERNRISVAEEHMATAITQYVISQLYPRLPVSSDARGRMIITGMQGELHQVGANMVADVLEAHGWDVRFLGTNLPDKAILSAIEQHDPEVVGISLTMLFNLPALVRLTDCIRTQCTPHPPRIILGGAAFRAVHTVGDELGCEVVDGGLRDAVTLLCES